MRTPLQTAGDSPRQDPVLGALNLSQPALRHVREAIDGGEHGLAWEYWADYFVARKKPLWIIDPVPYSRFMKSRFPAFRKVWIDVADRICAGYIHNDFQAPLGRDGKPDWFTQPLAEPPTHYGIGMRFLYFVFLRPLIRAYVLTGRKRYADVFIDFYRAMNHYMLDLEGMHELWIGIRVPVLFEAYFVLAKSGLLTPDLHKLMLSDIHRMTQWLHDFYRSRPRGYINRAPNQTVPGASWLIQAGIMLPDFRKSQQWLRCGKAKLERILDRTVYKDGGHVENCTMYHQAVMRDICAAALIMQRNLGRSYLTTECFAEKFIGMHRWLAAILTPDGYTPALNSAIYGTAWIIYCMTGNRFIQDPEIEWAIKQHVSRSYTPLQKRGLGLAAFLLNEDCLAAGHNIKPRHPASTSGNLPDSGFAKLCDGYGRDAFYMLLDYGHPVGGHAYPGRLSFVMWGNGVPLALQPGSPFWYHDPMYKEWFCTTFSHNTVIANNKSHDLQDASGRNIPARLHAWFDGTHTVAAVASHEGYKREANVTHARKVVLIKGKYFFVSDTLGPGREGNTFEWSFHSPLTLVRGKSMSVHSKEAPGVRLVPAYPKQIRRIKKSKGPCMVPITLQPDMSAQKQNIDYVNFEKTQNKTPVTFGMLVVPSKKDDHTAEDIGVTPLPGNLSADRAEAFRIEMPGRRDIVFFKHKGAAPARWDRLRSNALIGHVSEQRGSLTASAANVKIFDWNELPLINTDQSVSYEFSLTHGRVSVSIVASQPATARIWVGKVKSCTLNDQRTIKPDKNGTLLLKLRKPGKYSVSGR